MTSLEFNCRRGAVENWARRLTSGSWTKERLWVVAECGQLVSRRRLVWLGASDGNSANGEPVPIDRPQTISLICTTGVMLV
jgi:hypothetical protein